MKWGESKLFESLDAINVQSISNDEIFLLFLPNFLISFPLQEILMSGEPENLIMFKNIVDSIDENKFNQVFIEQNLYLNKIKVMLLYIKEYINNYNETDFKEFFEKFYYAHNETDEFNSIESYDENTFLITGDDDEVIHEEKIIVKNDDIIITKTSLRESIRKIKYFNSKLFKILLDDYLFREKLNFQF